MTGCAECGHPNPAQHRFCGECGARLPSLVPGGRERKVVTVLFCDLVGFTAASDGQDPEEIQARLSPYHAACRGVINRFGGTVEKFIGDAVMGVFGAPVAHEDDAERAVRAGLALLAALGELDEALGTALTVRIGVATGEAVVSLDARPELGEGMVVGDVVNTAARLQGAAPPGRVLVGRGTRERCRAAIEFEPHDRVLVKGKAAALSVWLATRARGSAGDELADSSTPLIGRTDELGRLERAFTRMLAERSVQQVSLVAEAGLGKSRLVQAFGEWVDGREELVTWRQGRTPPYGENVAYAAFAQILKSHFAILDSDPAGVALDRLRASVEDVLAGTPGADQAAWLVARLAALLGLPCDEAPREELFAAATRLLATMADQSPVILVLEDLHWADHGLVDLVGHLRRSLPGVPLMIVTTMRPDPGDGGSQGGLVGPDGVTITLEPLSDPEIAQLVSAILGVQVLPQERHTALVAKAAGNPLYAREYLHMLADGVGSPALDAVPGSLEALISARLDSLPPPLKGVLLAASAVGHTFWSGAVARVLDQDPEDLSAALDLLVGRAFLRTSQTSRIEGEKEFAFGHALIAEVAASRSPRADRARFHEAAAGWHAGRVADPTTSPDSALVAHHYGEAHRWAAALRQPGEQVSRTATLAATWHTHAAEQTRHRDVGTASRHARASVELATSDPRRRAAGLLLLGQLQWDAGEVDLAARSLADAHASADQAGLAVLAANARLTRAAVLTDLGRVAEAAALRDAAIRELRSHPPGPELVEAYLLLARDTAFSGGLQSAASAVDTALEVLDLLVDPPPRLRVRALELRGSQRSWSGDPGGLHDLTRALAVAQDHAMTVATIGIQDELASYHFFATSAAEAIALDRAALATATQCGHGTWELLLSANLTELLVMSGDLDDAVHGAQRALDHCRGVQNSNGWALLHTWWGRALALYGAPEAARVLATALDLARDCTQDVWATTLLVCAEQEQLRPAVVGPATNDLLDLLGDAPVQEMLAQYLGRVVRLTLSVGAPDLARSAMAATPTGMAMYDHNLLSARAAWAEHGGDRGSAGDLYARAAVAWGAYGDRQEQAIAVAGADRCGGEGG